MHSFSDRLAQARVALKISQRDLAKKLEATQGTYSSWELGKTSPKAHILEALCALGVDGHWLLTGEGQPLRGTKSLSQLKNVDETTIGQFRIREGEPDSAQYPSTKEYEEITLQEELRNLRETGLDQLFLLSQRGSQSGLWRVLKALGATDQALNLKELHAKILEDGEQPPALSHVAADAKLLVIQGILQERRDGSELYYKRITDAQIQAVSHVDMLQVVREAIRSLGLEFLPAMKQGNHSAWLANGELWVPDGKRFIARIREVCMQEIEAAHGEGERVYFLFATGLDVRVQGDNTIQPK